MNRKKLIQLFIGAALIATLSFGFFKAGMDDSPNVISYINEGGQVQMTAPVTQNYGDALGTWSAGANIPSPGSYGGTGLSYTRNDTTFIYCLNGDVDGSGTAPGQFRVYNVRTNTWTSLTNIPSGRAWTAGGRIGTILYFVGGLPSGATSWTQMTGTLQAFNILSGTWSTLAAAPTPTGSGGVVGYQDSLLYVCGGMGTGSAPITNVQLYNRITNTWRAATSLPAARSTCWAWITGDTLYIGCGAGPTTSTFNNTVYKGVISQSNRATITWTTASVTYPIPSHRSDADAFGCFGCIISPGATAWWGTGNAVYTWKGGTNSFVSAGSTPTATSDAMVGAGKFTRGGYDVWKFVVASGLVMAAPYHILNTQIYTDSCVAQVTSGFCEGFNTPTFPPTGWTLTGTPNLWIYNSVSAFGLGTGSAKADFYNISTGSAQLTSVTFTPPAAPITLRFANAYCTFVSENDQLQILASTNGGTNWTPVITLNGGVNGELVTAPPQTGAFTPTSTQWKWQTINLPAGTNKVQFNAISAYGNNLYIDSICVQTLTGIGSNNNNIANTYTLAQNYPNPFNPVTNIEYSIPKSEFVTLVVYDMAGREVKTLVNEQKTQGVYNVTFDGSSLASGVYFYKLVAGSFTETKRMVLIK